MTERKKPNNKRLILMIVLLAVVIALMWLLPDGSQPAAPATNAPKTEQTKNTNDAPDDIEATTLVKAGTQAPDFRVEMFDGTTFTLGSLRGKVVLLNFWATWCPPCVGELPHIEKQYAEYKDKMHFVILSVDDNEQDPARFIQSKGYTFPAAYGDHQALGRAYGIDAIPASYIISADGHIIARIVGSMNESSLDAFLQKAF